MTPKTKILELIKKFSPLVTTWDCYNDEPIEDKYILQDAKKCALIAVEEIIKEYNYFITASCNENDLQMFNKRKQYWEQIKKELEKI